MNPYVESVIAKNNIINATESEFLQSMEKLLTTLSPVIDRHPYSEYVKANLLERLIEPERTISFRLNWSSN